MSKQLPEWIQKEEEYEFKREKLMREALSIAWEALAIVSRHDALAKEAMKRIEELGR